MHEITAQCLYWILSLIRKCMYIDPLRGRRRQDGPDADLMTCSWTLGKTRHRHTHARRRSCRLPQAQLFIQVLAQGMWSFCSRAASQLVPPSTGFIHLLWSAVHHLSHHSHATTKELSPDNLALCSPTETYLNQHFRQPSAFGTLSLASSSPQPRPRSAEALPCM